MKINKKRQKMTKQQESDFLKYCARDLDITFSIMQKLPLTIDVTYEVVEDEHHSTSNKTETRTPREILSIS